MRKKQEAEELQYRDISRRNTADEAFQLKKTVFGAERSLSAAALRNRQVKRETMDELILCGRFALR